MSAESAHSINESLNQALQQGGLVITANDRLARQLRIDYAKSCQAQGQTVWDRPAIYSWNEWLQLCLDEWLDRALDNGQAPPLVLSLQQSEAVWQRLIEQSTAGPELLQTGATAASAAEAWDLLCGWQVPIESLQQYENEDTQAFAGWIETYKKRSQREGWLDPARLADCIKTAYQHAELVPPPALYLAGFDEQRPQQADLLQTLAELGCSVSELSYPVAGPVTIRQQPCADGMAEIRAAAHWTAQQLQADPEQRIGIVVQNLAGKRDVIARQFDEVLCVQGRLPGGPENRPYNISLGRPLLESALVRDALIALALGPGAASSSAGAVHWTEISALLRSPFFIGAEAESNARAKLDARLRRQGRERLSLRDLHFHAQAAADCPVLLRCIEQCRALADEVGGVVGNAEQAARFSHWLTAWGWSQGRTLASAEYQTVNAWWKLLAEFAALDAYSSQSSWRGGLAQLRRLAGTRLFQPQSPAAPVQILGLLEAAGMRFDKLWILGLHDDVWPASPRPQPLIPMPIQRRYQLPHATAERELAFARRVTERLLTSAAEITVSWPQREGDAQLRPSPLFTDLPPIAEPVTPLPDLMHWLQDHGVAAEPFSDTPPPPLSDDEKLHGGTAIVRNQAACPFRAFAQHRLHAEPLAEPLAGLDAAKRGSLVHEVMRVIWDELGSQAALLALDAAGREALVARCVETAVGHWEQSNATTLPLRFREVEIERLQSLATDWLTLDAERPPFEVIARESEQAINIAGLNLRGRLDRLDQLADGTRLIIDYKTGRVDPRVWLDERPDDPQLPLYALGQRQQLAGIAFAQIRIGELKYAGIAGRDDLAPGIEAVQAWKAAAETANDLPALLDFWQQQLEALARSFQAGESEVDPKDLRRTCLYCPQATLCRIDELSLGAHDFAENDNYSGGGHD